MPQATTATRTHPKPIAVRPTQANPPTHPKPPTPPAAAELSTQLIPAEAPAHQALAEARAHLAHTEEPHATNTQNHATALNPAHREGASTAAHRETASTPAHRSLATSRSHRALAILRAPDHLRTRGAHRLRARTERGAATAEYAITIVGACAIGGVLVSLLKSSGMLNALKSIINYGLQMAGVEGVQL